jgi:hypothetical protein
MINYYLASLSCCSCGLTVWADLLIDGLCRGILDCSGDSLAAYDAFSLIDPPKTSSHVFDFCWFFLLGLH